MDGKKNYEFEKKKWPDEQLRTFDDGGISEAIFKETTVVYLSFGVPRLTFLTTSSRAVFSNFFFFFNNIP